MYFVVQVFICFVCLLMFTCSVESSWPGVVNAMSGMLCAHLNAIGSSSTYNPLHSFKPQGAVIGVCVCV